MLSVHKSLHKLRAALTCAALCAPLALGLLPRRAAAQKAAARVETPFFAEDLTREKIGDIAGLDAQALPPARMAPDGHMIIMGSKTDVWVPEGKFIELKPKLKIAGFEPVTLKVIDGKQDPRSYGLEKTGELPMLRIDPPVAPANRKVVYVAVYDAVGSVRTLMECVVRAHIANPVPTVLTPRRKGEQCSLEIEDRQTLASTCLYLGDIYMGRVGDASGKIQMDERVLPPGKYSCQMVAQNTDGILLPGVSADYTVPNRYSITCADSSPVIVIPEQDADTKLKVTIRHTPGLSINKTRVYIAGNFAGEKDGDDFTMGLPLKDVPTGINTIEVLGIGPDDITYPVESITVNIKNGPWEQRTYSTQEYSRIAENIPKIKEQQRLVGYWLERADNEPAVFHASHTESLYFTFTEVTDKYVKSDKAEYKANAKKEFVRLTQLELESGKLYRKLKMRTRAKNMLYRVVQEVGSHTPDGVEAKAELEALKKERATSL